jgi:hypothetical protein
MTTTREVLADAVAGRPPALPGVRADSGQVTRRVRVRLGRARPADRRERAVGCLVACRRGRAHAPRPH